MIELKEFEDQIKSLRKKVNSCYMKKNKPSRGTLPSEDAKLCLIFEIEAESRANFLFVFRISEPLDPSKNAFPFSLKKDN